MTAEGTHTAAAAWDGVAEAWDTHVDDVDDHSQATVGTLVHRIAVRPGERLLELAAGPGSLGATWSHLVGPGGSVVVSDVAPAMVEVARRRNAALANVETAVIDQSAIDRPDRSFDVVVCRMGLMFASDPSAALAEIHRVTAPDGRLGALTWAGLVDNPWMTCVGMAAMLHGLVAGAPPVGPGGIFSLGDPVVLEQLVAGAGFTDVAVEPIDVVFSAPSVDAHIDRVSSLAGPLAAAIAGATPEQSAAFRRTAADLVAPYASDDGVAVPGRALLVSARRP